MHRGLLAAILLLSGLASGCASNLSNLKTAETLKKGQWRPSAEFGVFVPAGTIARAVKVAGEQAKALADARDGTSAAPTEAEQRAIFGTALSLAVFPPGTAMNLQLRYGITDAIDAGLRWSTTSYRADGRFRLLKREDEAQGRSFHLALVAGFEKQNFSGLFFDLYDYLQKAFDLFKFIELEKPSRWDLDLALIASWNFKEIIRPYVGLTYRLGFYKVPAVLSVELPGAQAPLIAEQSIKDQLHFMGITSGTAIGYRWIYLFLELDVAYLFSRPKILGERTNFGGLTFFPAAGLALRIP